jgi:Ca2+/H+ antiporter, TMEM165/GDT1 family
MKFAVGVMLSAYGVFWLGEGAGVSWPGGDASLFILAAAILGAAYLAVLVLRRSAPAPR